MIEFTAEQEAQSREFVKTAALAAVHINAVNEAVKLGDMDLLQGSLEFGEKISETILSQIPEDVRMEVLLELLGSALNL
ncbi:hypothetical protein SEA_EMMA1919_203 [Streptomyces phage Emma1919]|nr:hypothetical protein SEA_EMMA1919_203 [Streptomyces phage Emma1919]